MKNTLYNILSNLTARIASATDESPYVYIKNPMYGNKNLAVKAVNDILQNTDKRKLKSIRTMYIQNSPENNC